MLAERLFALDYGIQFFSFSASCFGEYILDELWPRIHNTLFDTLALRKRLIGAALACMADLDQYRYHTRQKIDDLTEPIAYKDIAFLEPEWIDNESVLTFLDNFHVTPLPESYLEVEHRLRNRRDFFNGLLD